MIVSIVAVSVAIFASPAAATPPVKYPYISTSSGELNDVCPFTINLTTTINGFGINYYDKNGMLIRSLNHNTEQDMFTANGKTLTGIPFTFSIEIFYDASGQMTHAYASGVTEKIPLPDGSLFIAAGRLDFLAHPGASFVLSPDSGNPGNVAGFCAALAP
jgi:hypothetical protein